jgi:hypothetical protein
MPVIRTIVKLTAKGFILWGLSAFAYQAYVWIRLGRWIDPDVLWMVHRSFSSDEGLELHGFSLWVFDFLPLPLSLIVLGVFLLAYVYRGGKDRSRVIDDVEKEMRARQDRDRL